jgi:putative ABC transport system permease protein
MRQIFRERYRAASSAGRRVRLSFLARTVVDVLSNAVLERAAAARRWWLFPNFQEPLASGEQENRSMLWQAFLMDLRFAARLFVRTPVFSGLSVVALALGIGANSAIFSVLNGVLLKPLPYAAPDEIVMIWSDNTRESRPEYPMSPANFLDYKAAARATRHVEAMFSFVAAGTIRTAAGTEQVTGSAVTPGMFSLLGRAAAVGRTLAPGDRGNLVVLSDGYWTRRFGRDPSVVGREIVFNDQPATIVGVMPADFTFPYKGMLGPSGFSRDLNVDLWGLLDPANRQTQFADASGRPNRSIHFLSVLARLAPGATIAQAQDEALAIARRLEEAYPDINKGLRARVVGLHDQALGTVRPALVLLLAGVGFVLLMTCVNVANLLLARSVARHKEMALRTALGAGRARLLRQALTESVALSLAGAALGAVFAAWATSAIVALAPGDMPRLGEIGLDWRVVAFTAGLSLVTGILIGLLPAFVAARTDVQGTLKDGSRGSTGSAARRRIRSALVTAEVALAVVLTVGAGLLVRSFVTLLDVNPGFRSEELLTMQITLPGRIGTPEARREYYRELFARLESLPGVRSAGGTTRLPLGSTNVSTRVAVEGRGTAPSDLPEVEFRRAVHNFFQTMGIPLLRGRVFDDTDGSGSAPVVVVNQTMARRLWPNEDPVGKRFRIGANPSAPLNTVVGLVGDIRHAGLDEEPASEFYIYYLQNPPVAPFIVIRTAGDPAGYAEAVRAELKALDKDLALYDIRTMTQIRSASVSQRRLVVVLAGVFGLLALTLAAVGVYGVMALVVAERTQEMGIRLALGAEPAQVLGLVVRQGLTLGAAGIVIGLVATLGVTPMLAGQLYGVGASDPLTLLAVPALLLAVALVACVLPARRAMRVDPVTALRYD